MMKYQHWCTFLAIVILQAFGLALDAQTLILNYNSVGIGRNAALSYRHQWGRHALLAGVKVHVNRTPQDNQNHVFHKRFHALSFTEHIGLSGAYNFHFPMRNGLSPFIGLHSQWSHASLRAYGYTFRLVNGGGTSGLIWSDWYMEPTTAWENNLVAGIEVPLGRGFHLYQFVGAGPAFFFNLDPEVFYFGGHEWEIGYILSMGISYDLKKRQP